MSSSAPIISYHSSSWTSSRYFLFLLWLSAIFLSCLFLFTGGFLLRRQVLLDKSTCQSTSNCNGTPHAFSKAIIIIVDALKYDFAKFNQSLNSKHHFQNKLPVINDLEMSGRGRLFEFMADPPTTTMQRLKGLTTGSLPTFIDISSNFGSYEIYEDNIIDQIVDQSKKVVFMGDDTWMGLFPSQFSLHYPFPSFDVWDLDTVDRGVTKHLFETVPKEDEWDVIVAHYLGVDHAGHKFGPRHPEMSRKLSEMNEVLANLTALVPANCLVMVMGDHGMTMNGDHGGDSDDELSAALFAYSDQFDFKNTTEHKSSVAQVDFVPTISLLLGTPIPFSNLGKMIPDLFEIKSRNPHQTLSQKLSYLKVNVQQVMTYLDAYRLQGGSLPQETYRQLRTKLEALREDLARPSSPERIEEVIRRGLDLLSECKSMCQSVWVEFDLNLMHGGPTLFLIHMSYVLLLIYIPRNRLLTGILTFKLLTYLMLSSLAGLAAGCFFLVLGVISAGDKGFEIVLGFSTASSIMVFGLNLLWRLRKSAKDIVQAISDARCFVHVAILLFAFVALFSNSYVVEEASFLNFCAMTMLSTFVWELRRSKRAGEDASLKWTVWVALAAAGIVRASNVYFRCREEQSSYCAPTDFHKPIGTLPKDMKTYRDWRFFSTILGMFLTVMVPDFWLGSCGNLNGISLAVSASSYLPKAIGIVMVSFWALQGHEIGSRLVLWQQNILAQIAFFLAFFVIAICLVQPRLVHKKGGGGGISLPEGVQDYFQFVRVNWRHFTSTSGGGARKVVYGLGTAVSAPLVVITTMLMLVSMLVLGDGLCPSMTLAYAAMAAFLYLSTRSRLGALRGGGGGDEANLGELFSVPWAAVIGWFLLESLFFYATGHQPTFPSIQWSAAFVGFSGSGYGGSDGGALSFALPALLIGWNTYASRVVFGVALPLLFLAPFALWIRLPSLRRGVTAADAPAAAAAATATPGGAAAPARPALAVRALTARDLEQGEMVLLENPEETKTQLFNLFCKYLVLQAFRLLGTMVAAAALQRHLMVWKIFAPRFIFEAVGFVVSVASASVGYAVVTRILESLLKYYRMLEKDK